jgi:hypothetical protein
MDVPEDNLFSRLTLHPSLSLVPHIGTRHSAAGKGRRDNFEVASLHSRCGVLGGVLRIEPTSSWVGRSGAKRMATAHAAGRHETPSGFWDLAPDDSGDSTAKLLSCRGYRVQTWCESSGSDDRTVRTDRAHSTQ